MAVGDSLGLPREGLSPRRADRIFGSSPLHHRFFFGRGVLSDDTEHACLTGQALLAAPFDEKAFGSALAFRLRFWLAALPSAVGWGTLRSILKLWIGFSPSRSGVVSAGNGAAMRAPVVGVCLAATPERIPAMMLASTSVTHRDPRAIQGALAIALATAFVARRPKGEFQWQALLDEIEPHLNHPELLSALASVRRCLERGDSPAQFAKEMGYEQGVSGYIVHTVAGALYCFLSNPLDFRGAVEAMILLGGDADTTGAIVGGLAGAARGASEIPKEWLDGIMDMPFSVPWIRKLALRLFTTFSASPRASAPPGPTPLCWPLFPLRNFLFLWIVLVHGFRRMLPPY